MKLLLILLAALLTSCSTPGGNSAHATAGTAYGTSRLHDQSSAAARPGRIADLRAFADALDAIAQGTVTRAAVLDLVTRHLAGDPGLQALGVLITAYFPEEETPVHHNPALSATARAIASGIRMSLPPAPVSK